MSITDPADVQPDEGQGEGGTTGTPYDEYLHRIPEDARGTVEPIFKEWDGNVTRMRQQDTEFRRSMEPYEQLGIARLPANEVEWLMQFRDALNNPSTIKEWYDSYASENGLQGQVAPPPPETTTFDEYGLADQNGQLEQLLEKQLGPLMNQVQSLTAFQQQQEQQTRLAEAERYVQGQIDELKTKHGQEFDEPLVERLIAQYIETDPEHAVQRAFADSLAVRNQIERQTLQSKVNVPPGAESGGVADGAPAEIKTLADANRIALERIRQARG